MVITAIYPWALFLIYSETRPAQIDNCFSHYVGHTGRDRQIDYAFTPFWKTGSNEEIAFEKFWTLEIWRPKCRETRRSQGPWGEFKAKWIKCSCKWLKCLYLSSGSHKSCLLKLQAALRGKDSGCEETDWERVQGRKVKGTVGRFFPPTYNGFEESMESWRIRAMIKRWLKRLRVHLQ